jgi:hypothetical protein
MAGKARQKNGFALGKFFLTKSQFDDPSYDLILMACQADADVTVAIPNGDLGRLTGDQGPML